MHEANGTKSLAVIARAMRLSSRSRVSGLLRGTNGTLPADETQLQLLVTALGGGEDDVSRGLHLYRRARSAARGSGRETTPAPRLRLPGPKPPSPIVLYPSVFEATVARLRSQGLVALVGPAGYGKSALAQQVIREPRLTETFGEHVYWLGIGRDLAAPDLAQRLNEVTFLASGVRPEVTDPVLAAQFLAGRLADRHHLLAFDDIWQQEWPEILRFVATAAAVLITTRDGTLLNADVEQHVLVGPPTELGALMLKSAAPALQDLDCTRVSAVMRARPFLLGLVSGQLRQEIQAGRPPEDAVDDLLHRVARASDFDGLVESVLGAGDGPTARSLLNWSIERLPPHHADRLRHLALFRSDQAVPLRMLAHVWKVPLHEAFTIVDQYRSRSLISELRFEGDDYLVNVHDILLDHLRHDLGPAEQATLHRTFVRSLVGLTLDSDDFDRTRLADAVETHAYLRDNLVWHLRAFLSPSRLTAIVTDPEYVGAKAMAAGVGAVLADLALVSDVDDWRTHRVARLTASMRHLRDRASATASVRSFLDEGRGGARGLRYRQVFALGNGDRPQRLQGSILGCSLNVAETEVLVTTSEGIVAVLDTSLLQPRWILRLPGGWTRACTFIPDGIAVGSDDGLIRLFRDGSHAPEAILAGHRGEVRALAVSPDGNWVVSASDDTTIRRWDLKTGLLFNTFHGHTDRVRALAVAPDGRWFVSASDDGTVRQWNSMDAAARGVLRGHTARVRGVAVSPDGLQIASVSDDGTVRLWSADGNRGDSRVIGEHGCVIRDVAFTGDGSAVLTAGAHDNLLSLWPVRGQPARHNLVGHTSWVMCCLTTRATALAVSGSDDGTVRLWDLTNGREVVRHEGRNEWVFAISTDVNSDLLYVGTTASRLIRLGSRPDHAVVDQVEMSSGVRGLAVGPSGALLAGTDSGELLHIAPQSASWNVRDIRKLSKRGVRRVQQVPERGIVVTSCHDGQIYLLRWIDGELRPTRQIGTGHGSVYEARLLPGTDLLVSVHESGDVCLHRLDGQLLSQVSAHRGPALCIDVSSDGHSIVTGGDDGVVRHLTVDSSTLLDRRVVGTHDDWVGQVAVSPDGRRVASVSDDHTVRINVLAHESPEMALAFEQPLYCALWRADHDELVVGGAAGVYVIDGW
ncbi:NB-ARC domain-containing protein [Micromonospora sp. WMMD956]|uniref:WD40 domain-containing protein n=1 Tax=Micromonospora sp. WMMD956 TaxID=3016108 RepID=UPI002415E494|nr:NB-ARC domain-containing protein [Micromonospora sp. WMMD956]MDG4814249.1 NB-ARC domain-containing protein [Micromonospora sp. WMMD956]